MCKRLEVSRSGFYAWVRRGPSAHQRRDAGLEKLVAEHFTESNGVYGSPRIHALLRRRGERVGRKRVVRLMQRLHLRARANRIYRPRGCAPVCRLSLPNEARCRTVTGPNQVWRGDVTYLKAAGTWRYLAVVMDQYSRRLIGYQLGRDRTSDLTVAALVHALAKRKPPAGLVFHSDRGGEYCGYLYRDRLESSGIVQSINRPKTMTDNAYVESFFHSLKTEAIHGRRFSDHSQLDAVVRRYIQRYNRSRIHSSLAYMSPIDYERTNA